MSDDHALGVDMHPPLGSLEPTPPADGQDFLDRLLSEEVMAKALGR